MNNPSQFRYRQFTINYRTDSVDEKILEHSFDNDIFYKELPDLRLTQSPIIIDIGAHIGTFIILTHYLFPIAKIYGLEPNTETYAILKENIDVNGLSSSVTVLNQAISNRTGVQKLYLHEENWGHSLAKNFGTGFEEINTSTLSDFLKSQNISDVDLIKMNCEGAEFDIILNSDRNTLLKAKMFLILCHEDLVIDQKSITSLIEYLKESGFLVRVARNKEERSWVVAKNKYYYSGHSHQLLRLRKNWKREWQKAKQFLASLV